VSKGAAVAVAITHSRNQAQWEFPAALTVSLPTPLVV